MERTIPQNTRSHDYSTLSESFDSDSEIFNDDDIVEVDEVEVDEKDLENEFYERDKEKEKTWYDGFKRVSNYISRAALLRFSYIIVRCCIVKIFIRNYRFFYLAISGRNLTKIRNIQKNGTLTTSAHARKKM